MTALFADAARTLIGLAAHPIGLSHVQRTEHYLGEMERAAQAEIAKVHSTAMPSRSRLDAALMYEKGVGSRLDGLWKEYRALQAEQPEPAKQGLIHRLMGRAPDQVAVEKIEQELARLHAGIVEVQRTWDKARAGVALAERNHRAAETAQKAQATETIRQASRVLHQVRIARRLVAVYPRLAFCGPAFVHWTARRATGEKQRYHSNPQARNIWGLPLEP